MRFGCPAVMSDKIGDHPGVLVRPPRLYLAALGLGFLCDALWPAAILPAPVQATAGGFLIGSGFGLALWSMRHFAAAGTSVPTVRPASALVTSGPYRFSRNPIYVGMTVVSAGVAVAADVPWIVVWLVPTLVILRVGVIAREERYLAARFGAAYADYRARVRRWL